MHSRQFRSQQRVYRVADALERLEAKIAAHPKHPRLKAWHARAEEYRQSLIHFNDIGTERPVPPQRDPKGGVDLDVPLGKFNLKGAK